MSMDLQTFVSAAIKAIKDGATTVQVAQDLKVDFDLAVRQDTKNPAQIEVDQSQPPAALKLKFEVVVPIRP
jgi:hypothetical protein